MRSDLLLVLLVPMGFAAVVLLPTALGAGFLSDDYVLCNLIDADGRGADWAEIGAQVGDRWLYSNAYWRPVVNLAYGINTELTGFTATGLVLANLFMHLLVVGATAWLAFTMAGRGRKGVTIGIAATLPLVLHPASVETVLWISARVTGVEVCLRMLTLCVFLAHLRSPSRGRYLLVVVGSALTLAAKESAVVLPVALLAVDLLDRPARPWRERLRLHLPLVGVWLGYALVRLAVLGSFVGSPIPDPSLAELADLTLSKLERLFAPGPGAWLLVGVAVLWIGSLLASGGRRGRLIAALVCVGWVIACLAPAYKAPLGSGLVGSRMLYGALPVVGLALTRGMAGATSARAGLLGAGLLAWSAGLGLFALSSMAGNGYLKQFEDAWQRGAAASARLVEAGDGASWERPVGLLSWPPCREVPGPIHPVAFFRLGAPPYHEPELPLVGLGAMLQELPYTAAAYQDARPLHALLGLGMPVVRWDESRRELATWRHDAGAEPEVARGSELRLRELRGPGAVQCLEIVADLEVSGGAITLLTSIGEFGPPLGLNFTGGEGFGDQRLFRVDLTSHAPLLTLALGSGELRGFRVDCNGGAVRQLRALPTLPDLPLGVPRQTEIVTPYADLDAALPSAPASRPGLPLDLVLMGQSVTFVAPCEPGQPVALPGDVRESLRTLAHAMKARRFWCFFQTRPTPGQPGAARSQVFRLRLTDVPR